MQDQIVNLLAQAQMSAVMVAEQMTDYDAPKAVAAARAISAAERRPSPLNNKLAANAAEAWIAANESAAIEIIQRRIDARAASASRSLSDGAQRALRGQD